MFLVKTIEKGNIRGSSEEASEDGWVGFKTKTEGHGSCPGWGHTGREGGLFGGAPQALVTKILMRQLIPGRVDAVRRRAHRGPPQSPEGPRLQVAMESLTTAWQQISLDAIKLQKQSSEKRKEELARAPMSHCSSPFCCLFTHFFRLETVPHSPPLRKSLVVEYSFEYGFYKQDPLASLQLIY